MGCILILMSGTETYYRVHPAGEPVGTCLDSSRPDGWVMDERVREAGVLGVSCCRSLEALSEYIATYDMYVADGDSVVAVTGTAIDGPDDGEVVVQAATARRIGSGKSLTTIIEMVENSRSRSMWSVDQMVGKNE